MEAVISTPMEVAKPTIEVWRTPKYWKRDVFLSFTIWYVSASGRHRWTDGTMLYWTPESAQQLLDEVLSKTTDFVRGQWIRVEVYLPNRDAYNNLQAGFVGDQGVLLATRLLK